VAERVPKFGLMRRVVRFYDLLEKHRRTILDTFGIALLLAGLAILLLALLTPKEARIRPGDWIDAGSVMVAAGGVLFGLGQPRGSSGSHHDRRSQLGSRS
jgi:hypothetical protein